MSQILAELNPLLVSSSNVFGMDLCPNRNEIYEHLQPIWVKALFDITHSNNGKLIFSLKFCFIKFKNLPQHWRNFTHRGLTPLQLPPPELQICSTDAYLWPTTTTNSATVAATRASNLFNQCISISYYYNARSLPPATTTTYARHQPPQPTTKT